MDKQSSLSRGSQLYSSCLITILRWGAVFIRMQASQPITLVNHWRWYLVMIRLHIIIDTSGFMSDLCQRKMRKDYGSSESELSDECVHIFIFTLRNFMYQVTEMSNHSFYSSLRNRFDPSNFSLLISTVFINPWLGILHDGKTLFICFK